MQNYDKQMQNHDKTEMQNVHKETVHSAQHPIVS